jgi:hypothetical protein
VQVAGATSSSIVEGVAITNLSVPPPAPGSGPLRAGCAAGPRVTTCTIEGRGREPTGSTSRHLDSRPPTSRWRFRRGWPLPPRAVTWSGRRRPSRWPSSRSESTSMKWSRNRCRRGSWLDGIPSCRERPLRIARGRRRRQ